MKNVFEQELVSTIFVRALHKCEELPDDRKITTACC